MTIFPISSSDDVGAAKEAILRENMQLFDTLFPTEADCLEGLLKRLSDEEVLKCRYCGSLDLEHGHGARVSKCQSCKKETFLTAGTFFAHIRTARPWLVAFWLMGRGVSFSAADLRRLVNRAYSTAGKILKKIKIVIHRCMETEADAIAVSSALFAPAICKRSLETPANKHPVAEEEEMEKRILDDEDESIQPVIPSGASGRAIPSATSASMLCGPEKIVYEILSTEPISADDLCMQTGIPVGKLLSALSMLEIEGLIEGQAGDRYVRSDAAIETASQAATMQSVNGHGTMIDATNSVAASIDFVRAAYHGISRKYLQLYLAAHWCYVDRERWSSNSLFKACIRFREIKYAEIRAFVSPLLVKLMPC